MICVLPLSLRINESYAKLMRFRFISDKIVDKFIV